MSNPSRKKKEFLGVRQRQRRVKQLLDTLYSSSSDDTSIEEVCEETLQFPSTEAMEAVSENENRLVTVDSSIPANGILDNHACPETNECAQSNIVAYGPFVNEANDAYTHFEESSDSYDESHTDLESNNSYDDDDCNYEWEDYRGSEKDIDDIDEKKRRMKENLAHWAAAGNIPRQQVNELLKVLRSDENLSYLPLSYKTLLRTPKRIEFIDVHPGQYVHFGLSKCVLKALSNVQFENLPTSIRAFINIDGIPLTKSSRSECWPILGYFPDFPECGVSVIGIYQGNKKPSSVNDFLDPFVAEASTLERTGLNYKGKKIKVVIDAIICDAVARAFITCVKSHSAYYGCPKCETRGEFIKNFNSDQGRVTFPSLFARKRTNESFRNRFQREHHNGRSLIEDLMIDMVKNIPNDGMHLSYLGVMRKLLKTWVHGSYVRGIKLTNANIDKISSFLILIAKYLSIDFARKCRSLQELDRFKATELRIFLLYIGPVVLRNILPEELLNHFLLLHVSSRILSNESVCQTNEWNTYCEDLLMHFVRKASRLYSPRFISFNCHSLIHLPDDVKKFGSLESFSAFRFENHLQILKNLVQKSARPLAQVVNRLNEIEENVKTFPTIQSNSDPIVSDEHLCGPMLQQCKGKQFKRVRYGIWRLSNQVPDNCVFINGLVPILIENIIKTGTGNVFILGRKYLITSDLFSIPLSSRKIGTHKVESGNLSDLNCWPISSIMGKALRIPLNCPPDETYVISHLSRQDAVHDEL